MRIVTPALVAVIALILAGCSTGGATTAPESATSVAAGKPTLFRKQKIERIANRWAPLYAVASNPDACKGFQGLHPYREIAAKYMAQPACERTVCKRGLPSRRIKNCTPPSPGFQRSFAGATVEKVAIQAGEATAKFSNGEVVELSDGRGGPKGCFGSACGDEPTSGDLFPAWLIVKVGGDAGSRFFD